MNLASCSSDDGQRAALVRSSHIGAFGDTSLDVVKSAIPINSRDSGRIQKGDAVALRE